MSEPKASHHVATRFEQLGFILPSLYAYGAAAVAIALAVGGLYYWHHTKIQAYTVQVQAKMTEAHQTALVNALTAQKEQSDANALTLTKHITALAKSRNQNLLNAQATARSIAANSSSLDSLLDAIARSDASCLAANNLPKSPAPGPSSPLPSTTPGQLFPECAKSLRQMAEYSDALADQIRALQGYTESLTPFFEPRP